MSTETSDMPDAALERSISAVREFSRFYTARMGVLREHLPDSGFSLTEALRIVRNRLGGWREGPVAYSLRPHRPGDMGWIVHRHGALYAEEYGWDETFEALVAEVAAEFIRNFDRKRERAWIAEREDAILGAVLLVKGGEETAKLRLLYVEPQARGLGIGRKLVNECTRFARSA